MLRLFCFQLRLDRPHLGWPLRPFEKCYYIGSPINATMENVKYPRGLPSHSVIQGRDPGCPLRTLLSKPSNPQAPFKPSFQLPLRTLQPFPGPLLEQTFFVPLSSPLLHLLIVFPTSFFRTCPQPRLVGI